MGGLSARYCFNEAESMLADISSAVERVRGACKLELSFVA